MARRHLQVLPGVVDHSNARWLVRYAGLTIPLDRVVGPGTVPQAVDNVHILVGDLVALVMRHELLAKGGRGRLGPAGDHVPGYTALGQVVERAVCAGQWERRDVARTAGDPERDRLRHSLVLSATVLTCRGTTAIQTSRTYRTACADTMTSGSSWATWVPARRIASMLPP